MRVGIVGAGISGLAAARKLQQAGHEPVVFEAAPSVGGRATTIEFMSCLADPGLQAYTPRGMAIENVLLNELPTDGLQKIEKPIHILSHGRPIPGSQEKNQQPRYTYETGAIRFPELLSEGLDVRLHSPVESLERRQTRFSIRDEEFDSLILTPPLPEVGRLLGTIGKSRSIANASYRPCLSVVLAYDRSLEPAPPYSALLSDDRMSPVLWLGIETEKSKNRAPEGWTVFVAQFGPGYSKQHLESPESSIVPVCLSLIVRLFGPKFSSPSGHYIKRWVESQPERVALFQSVNPTGEKIIVAGDGTFAGRAENAYESGLMAADRIIGMEDR
jgi:renalase